MDKKKILFIINPIAGVRKKTDIKDLCERFLNKDFFLPSYTFTEYAGHGFEISLENHDKFDIIVAVGGDGTINEIARALIQTECALAIIPLGSGNGLARHLKIPLTPRKAILHINESTSSLIDTCTFNGRPFLCTAGIGFEAEVSWAFDQAPSRGLATYLKMIRRLIKNFRPLHLSLPAELNASETFSLTFANAEQYGNNAFIAPFASLSDGVMNICQTRPFPKFALLPLIIKMGLRKIKSSQYYATVERTNLTVEIPKDTLAHIDGEPIRLSSNSLTVQVIPASLKIWS